MFPSCRCHFQPIVVMLQRVATKDFSRENRGVADVEVFMKQAKVLLDVQETNLERILDHMLAAALATEPTSNPVTADDAKQEIFTHDRGTCLPV